MGVVIIKVVSVFVSRIPTVLVPVIMLWAFALVLVISGLGVSAGVACGVVMGVLAGVRVGVSHACHFLNEGRWCRRARCSSLR